MPASSDVQRNQPGQAADAEAGGGAIVRADEGERLSCSLFWFKSVMFTAWKSRKKQVRAEEQKVLAAPLAI